MFKKLLMIAWVGLVGLTVSCKGPQGDVGPQGEQGATGATGPQGPAGQSGEGGTGAFVYTHGADTSDVNGNFYSGFSFDAEAKDILETAAVLIYAKAQGVYWPIPGTVIYAQDKVSSYTFVHYIDGTDFLIDIIQTGASEQTTPTPVRILQDIKVLIVPAELLGRANGELKTKSYEEAVALLGLEGKSIKNITPINR